MSIVNVESIINGTPEKRVLLAYNKMKENYNEATAEEFKDTYDKESLSVLLENSDKIFSEPYFGLEYYEKSLKENCSFTSLESEVYKIERFVDENKDKMNYKQRDIYESFLENMKSYLDDTKNTRIMATYIKENIDPEFENTLSEALYKYYESPECDGKISAIFESIDNPVVFFTYVPYVYEKTNMSDIIKLSESFCESASLQMDITTESWKAYVDTTVCCNKLHNDKAYTEAVNDIKNKDHKIIFEYFMNGSVIDSLNELTKVKVSNDVFTESSVEAVNNIFLDMYEASIETEEDLSDKYTKDAYRAIAYETTLDILYTEFTSVDDTDAIAEGYSLLESDMSISSAFECVSSAYNDLYDTYSEATEDNDEVDDEDIDNEEDASEEDNEDPKKPVAPKSKSLATKIQNKGMDAEAKHFKKSAERQAKGQEIKGAVKAVTAVPRNIINKLKSEVQRFDQMDDERRKNFMRKPGFRKSAFKKLKLAIMYGTAAQCKLALVIPLAICRHFSKDKDRRIRNELIMEIDTQIKVTDAKISDAEAKGDRKELYHLIRIKDQLTRERSRVLTNSKYI